MKKQHLTKDLQEEENIPMIPKSEWLSNWDWPFKEGDQNLAWYGAKKLSKKIKSARNLHAANKFYCNVVRKASVERLDYGQFHF